MPNTVLLIEDNTLISNYITRILQSSFHDQLQVYASRSYFEAVKLIESVAIDIFLIDIELSGEYSGIDVARLIRQKDELKDSKIIFQSADAASIYRLANEVHFYGYLVKPYNAKELVDLFSKLLQSEPFVADTHYQTIDLDSKNAHLDSSVYDVFLNKNLSTRVKLFDIVFIEAINKKIVFHTVKGLFETYYLTLDKFMEDIKDKYFVRCHKSFIINTHYFSLYDRSKQQIILTYQDGDIAVDVGRKYVGEVRERFREK